MKPKHFINLETQYGANNYASLDVVITKGQGIWVEDVDGNRYMDCLSAYSAVNQGHCHPKILQTMIEQAKRLTLTSRAFRNDQLGPLNTSAGKKTGCGRVCGSIHEGMGRRYGLTSNLIPARW